MAKKFKSWAWEKNEAKGELTILVQDCKKGWVSVGTISADLEGKTDEEIDEEYNDLMTEVIDELGYTSIWCD